MKLPFVIVRRSDADWIVDRARKAVKNYGEAHRNVVCDGYARFHVAALKRIIHSLGGSKGLQK